MLSISMRAELGGLHRTMQDLRGTQIPFANALALTALARGVEQAEDAQTRETFKHPTPFTQRGFRTVPATKGNQVAMVLAKDIQAGYLAPYVLGGMRSLGSKKAMLVPKAVGTNIYGNLPRGKLQQLKGQPGVFVGPITFRKTGKTISGVWQRGVTARGGRYKGGGEYGTRGKNTTVIDGVRTTLKLLVRFEDTTEAPTRFPLEQVARTYVARHARDEYARALRKALATRRR